MQTFPHLLGSSLFRRQRRLAPYRSRVVSSATGRVLEVGIGSGLNLPFYGNTVAEIIGLEPSPKLLDMANAAARKSQIPLRLIEGTAEAIPIEEQSVDAVRALSRPLCSQKSLWRHFVVYFFAAVRVKQRRGRQ
jgi:predicted RNA methylase